MAEPSPRSEDRHRFGPARQRRVRTEAEPRETQRAAHACGDGLAERGAPVGKELVEGLAGG